MVQLSSQSSKFKPKDAHGDPRGHVSQKKSKPMILANRGNPQAPEEKNSSTVGSALPKEKNQLANMSTKVLTSLMSLNNHDHGINYIRTVA